MYQMKKHILHIRKQSGIEPPKDSIWFFSEDNKTVQSPSPKRNLNRNDRLRILSDDYNRHSSENRGKFSNKKDCSFVVDWQMSDIF
jgi:hypothetical protein